VMAMTEVDQPSTEGEQALLRIEKRRDDGIPEE
jgi:hypothetical protein